MRIAVIGAGAMGSIYGGHLSLHNDVYLIDTNKEVVDHINKNGLTIQEDGKDVVYRPTAVTETSGLEPMDLVILFVKALFSEAALNSCKNIIGDNTYLLTLQNGSGHEDILQKFVPLSRVVIGTTQDNGNVLAPGHVKRGGNGGTNIGLLIADENSRLPEFKKTFEDCGFVVTIYDKIQQLIWDKLFTNVSLSALTGVLQVPMGYIAGNEHAWKIASLLVKEAVAVAKALGLEADEAAILEKVRSGSINNPDGITSICADLRDGRKTEVATISGSVVNAAKKCGVSVPTHEMMVTLIRALEERKRA